MTSTSLLAKVIGNRVLATYIFSFQGSSLKGVKSLPFPYLDKVPCFAHPFHKKLKKFFEKLKELLLMTNLLVTKSSYFLQFIHLY